MLDTNEKLFAEAESLNQLGKLEQARALLGQAADGGHHASIYRLAISESAGLGGPLDQSRAAERLEKIAEAYPPARMFYAVATASGWASEEDWPAAIAQHIQYATTGDPGAIFDLGLLCLLRDPETLGEMAQACFASALSAGAIFAAPALMRWHALRGERFLPAQGVLTALKNSGYLPLADLHTMANSTTKPAASVTTQPDWPRIERELQSWPDTWRSGKGDSLADAIDAATWAADTHPCICDFLTGYAGPAFEPAQIYDSKTGRLTPHPVRKALQAGMQPYRQTLTMHALERIMAERAGLPWKNAERLTILLYRVGDFYARHADYFSETSEEDVARLNASGQRERTALLSLQPAERGGATHFPRLNAKWLGQTGEMLCFSNLTPDGKPNPMSLHEGQVIESGWKSLASLWIRARPYKTA